MASKHDLKYIEDHKMWLNLVEVFSTQKSTKGTLSKHVQKGHTKNYTRNAKTKKNVLQIWIGQPYQESVLETGNMQEMQAKVDWEEAHLSSENWMHKVQKKNSITLWGSIFTWACTANTKTEWWQAHHFMKMKVRLSVQIIIA